jgi:hypothetical protein
MGSHLIHSFSFDGTYNFMWADVKNGDNSYAEYKPLHPLTVEPWKPFKAKIYSYSKEHDDFKFAIAIEQQIDFLKIFEEGELKCIDEVKGHEMHFKMYPIPSRYKKSIRLTYFKIIKNVS